MMKSLHKPLLVLLGFCVVIVAAAPLQAQTSVCVGRYLYYFQDPYGLPPGVYDCGSWAPSIADCKIKTTCPPETAGSETCPTCPHAGQPIALSTGNTYITQQDVRIPGLGGGLSLVRTWNSKWPASQSSSRTGMFGANWRSTYEERIFLDTRDRYLRYARADGSYWSFGFGGPNPAPDYTFSYVLVAERKGGTQDHLGGHACVVSPLRGFRSFLYG